MSHEPSAMAGSDLGDVAGLRALGAVDDLEFHRLAFLERTEAVALNSRVVHEDIAAPVTLDESVPLGVVEPLDLACNTHRSLPTCCDALACCEARARRWTKVREPKKKAALCGLSLTAPGPPGVDWIILDFAVYAKSVAQRIQQDTHRRSGPRPRRSRLRTGLDGRHGARPGRCRSPRHQCRGRHRLSRDD